MTVQPHRVANGRMASMCIAKVCWSWGDTRADRAARMSDTKLSGKWWQAIVECAGVSVSQIWGDTPLVLCQHGSQGVPRACSSRRRRGSPVYLGRAVPSSPQTRVEIAVVGRLGLFRTTSGMSILRGRSAHRHGALYVTGYSTQGCWLRPAPHHAGRDPRPRRAGPCTSGLGGARAHALLQPRSGHGRLRERRYGSPG